MAQVLSLETARGLSREGVRHEDPDDAIQLFGADFHLTPLVPLLSQPGERLGCEALVERAGRHNADLGTPYATAFTKKYRHRSLGMEAGAFIVFPGAQRKDVYGSTVELCLFWNGTCWTTLWGLFELGYEQDIFFLVPEARSSAAIPAAQPD